MGSAEVGGACGAGVEVLAAQPVAVAFEAEDFGVVDQPVDHRGGGHVVAEDLSPRAERLVGRAESRGAKGRRVPSSARAAEPKIRTPPGSGGGGPSRS